MEGKESRLLQIEQRIRPVPGNGKPSHQARSEVSQTGTVFRIAFHGKLPSSKQDEWNGQRRQLLALWTGHSLPFECAGARTRGS